MSVPADPVEEKVKPELVEKEPEMVLQVTGNFQVFSCKECMAIVADPLLHSTNERHLKGYLIHLVNIEQEVPTEKVEADKKAQAQSAKAAANSVITGKPKQPPRQLNA